MSPTAEDADAEAADPNAAQMAVGLGADVTILDRSPAALERLAMCFESRAKTRCSNTATSRSMS